MFKLNSEKFLDEINRRWRNKNCPMCSQNHWNVDANMVTAIKLSEDGGIELGGQVMPLVAVTCTNCGNVMFVNPLVIQCIDSNDAKENK